MSTVSENIRYLRKLKGYTQEQFAEQIGIKRSLLGAYEEARANPNEIYLDSIAELLGVPVEHLLNENLKERGRKMGPGTILKLNPDMPEPASHPESQAADKLEVPEDEPVRFAQMDLFAGAGKPSSAPAEKAPAGQPAEKKGSKAPEESFSPESGFIGMLNNLLSAQKTIRLFSDLADIPVRGLHLIGHRLDEVAAIENNGLYILVLKEGAFLFRRAFNQIAIKGTVILSSDFPDKPTLEIPHSDIAEAYLYMASLQTGAPSAVVPVRRLKELTEEMTRLLSAGR